MLNYSKIKKLNLTDYDVEGNRTGLLVNVEKNGLEIKLKVKDNALGEFMPEAKVYLYIGDDNFDERGIQNLIIKLNEYLDVFAQKHSTNYVKKYFADLVYKTFAKLAYTNLGINKYAGLVEITQKYLMSYYKRNLKRIEKLSKEEKTRRIEEVINNNRLLFLKRASNLKNDKLASMVLKDLEKQEKEIKKTA